MKKCIICITILVLLFAANVFAATFYVDFLNGDDSWQGTINQPWKHCPGMSEWSGSHSHQSGDVYILKRGQTFPEIAALSGGTYKSEDGWGTGSYAIVTGNITHEGYGTAAIFCYRTSNVTIDGLEITGSTGSGYIAASDGNNNTLLNSYIHDNGDTEVMCSHPVIVKDNIINPNGATHTAMFIIWAPNSLISGNIIYSGYNFTVKIAGDSNGTIVEYNYIQCPTTGDIAKYGLIYRSTNSGRIRYNLIDCTDASDGVGIILWNNGIEPIEYDNKIYNNTIISNGGDDIGINLSQQRDIQIINNIIYNAQTAFYIWAGNEGTNTAQYNCIYDVNTLKAGSGADELSVSNTFTDDPQFKGSNFGPDNINDFQIKSSSPCRDKGILYDSFSGTDYWGNKVPQGSSPEIGAFELSKAMLAAPINLRIINIVK